MLQGVFLSFARLGKQLLRQIMFCSWTWNNDDFSPSEEKTLHQDERGTANTGKIQTKLGCFVCIFWTDEEMWKVWLSGPSVLESWSLSLLFRSIHTMPYPSCRTQLKWHLPLLTLVPLCELVTWTPFVIAGRKLAFARFETPVLL